MLPDYPFLKAKIRERLMRQMDEQRYAAMGIMGEVPRSIIFEGSKSLVVRDDGSIQEVEYKLASSQLSLSKEELESASPEDIMGKLSETAEDLASQQSKAAFKTMNEEIDKVGNTVDGKGKQLIDVYLEAIEKVFIDFDRETSKPRLPTFVMHPDLMEKATKELQKIETDPHYKNIFEKLIEKKREEWNARESNRKLVG